MELLFFNTSPEVTCGIVGTCRRSQVERSGCAEEQRRRTGAAGTLDGTAEEKWRLCIKARRELLLGCSGGGREHGRCSDRDMKKAEEEE